MQWNVRAEAVKRHCKKEDVSKATDYVSPQINIAARIRRIKPEYLNYMNEFTIRSSRPGGIKTEIDKILDGHGDWLFYAYAFVAKVDSDAKLPIWSLINLEKFRFYFKKGEIDYQKRFNKDGSSGFYVFNLEQLPADKNA